jgi:hypothetical protein
MGGLEITLRWIMDIITNVLVPALVWALVIAGLVWVVQDKLREDRRREVEGGAEAWGVRAGGRLSNQKSERS